MKDSFNNHNSSSEIVKTSNYEIVYPFSSQEDSASKLPLVYRGTGLDLVNYENYQLYNLVKAEATTYSRQVDNKMTTRAGSEITMVAALQGLNNARCVISGSLDFFSD